MAERVGFEPTCGYKPQTDFEFYKVRVRISLSVSDSFVLAAKPHKYWLFHAKTPKKPVISGEFESTEKCAKTRIFGKNYGKN